MDVIKKIIKYYKPYKKDLFLDLLCSIIQSGCVISIPILTKYLTINALNAEKDVAYRICFLFAISIAVLFIIRMLCVKYREYHGKMIAERFESDIKLDLFKHFQKQDLDFFNENKTGKLVSHITVDAHNLSQFSIHFPEVMLEFSMRFIGVGIFLFLSNYIFGTIIFVIIFLILFFSVQFIFKIKKAATISRQVYANLTSDLNENVSGIKTIKTFANEDEEILKFINNTDEYMVAVEKKIELISKIKSLVGPFLMGMAPLMSLIAIFFILNEKLTLNDLIACLLYVDILVSPIFNIFELISEYIESIVGIKRIFSVLSINPKIVDLDNSIHLETTKGNIKFKGVSFKYKSSNRLILDDINLEINSGEHVALVGRSGVGKSSICNLIPRFYDVTEGEILLDNIPIKNIKLKDLRNNISFVQQDTFLFSNTIIENIRYGRLTATNEEVFEAAKNAYADEFILKFENGYQTQIGERGTRLSGGQKQRLAIARAFLKNAPILIFDEATSNLDSESEKFIQKSMENLSKNKTTIVIAHRLSTIKNANKIFVLDNQRIQAVGTHQELLKNNGIYKNLYNQQFLVNL